MICERCGQRQAQVKYIEVEEGVKRSRWLCEVCAAEEGAQIPPDQEEPPASDDLSLFMGAAPAPRPSTDPEEIPCPHCGTVFSALEDNGLLGCARCYEFFKGELKPVLSRFHRAVAHVGKAPRARGPRAQRRLLVNQLRQRLDAAVAGEDFESAARIRDEIAKLARNDEDDEAGDGDR